ncbi:ABC transporter ATP-binding protein [Mucilaginibacter psychrotolerans]|uniref:ABC transporter ATP-binding protein n=1 Tax=Mucilaginibacter psychrotolerans TaxID=1524096 RepID=A0A4Y8S454_9SPHI|nr:ABC transporter ATP-binding protein [Mucilaginibacter psychrotolerans]TFF33702.1 ABC transporter ATP-binding protein [Mucilaginibacter psychrotolerans]
MKTYFRLLSFAKPIGKFAVPYIICTILYVVFSTSVIVLIGPLLNTLFHIGTDAAALKPTGKPSLFDFSGYFNYYLDYFLHTYDKWTALKFVCVVLVVSVFLGNFFRYLAQRIMENLRVYTLHNLRKAVFENVMNMHMAYFNNERKGDIITKVASDVQVVQFSVTATLQVVFKEPMQLIGFLYVLFRYSVNLTLISLIVLPLSGFIISRIVKRLKAQAISGQETYSTMISYLDEALSGIKIVKAFNATDFVKERFENENTTYSRITKSIAKRQQMASPVSEALSITMVAFILLYGGYRVFNNTSELSPGDFVAYIAVFSQLMRPAKAITDSFSNIHSGIAAGERVLDLIDEKPEITDAKNAVALTGFEDAIRFENVTFAYQERQVLSNVNITIPKGKSVALVGPSGGGKSTMMDLIPRFMDPQEGCITVDGEDIKHVTAYSLRALMGVVNQESLLFNDTIYNNIAFGKKDVKPEEVEAAARIANAHNFILETDKGYDTNVGDRGAKLSGGQRQRICIARAVLSNPPIMLLDEATSALDTESEKLVQDALNNLMKNRTSLIIAHRLSTIQNADMIIVLESGKVVEQGNHQELMANNGLYRKLIDMQTFNEN